MPSLHHFSTVNVSPSISATGSSTPISFAQAFRLRPSPILYSSSPPPLIDLLQLRWKKEARSVENFDEKAAMPIFTNNVRSGPFHHDLVQNCPKMYAALLDRAARFAEAEEAERKNKEEERGRGRDKAPREGKTQVSWREGETQVSWDLELRGGRRPRGRERPRGLGRPRGGAADLEALGVKGKYKFQGVKAKHKFHGVKAKQKFRGCEAPKQDQVELGTQKVEDDLEAVNDPEAVENDLEAVNDPEALDDPEVVDNPEAVADPGTVGSHALGLNPQSRPNGTPPWRTRASATQHSKAGNPRHRK
nr:uncharacterized protein LOC109184102 [Ipomoea batatas]